MGSAVGTTIGAWFAPEVLGTGSLGTTRLAVIVPLVLLAVRFAWPGSRTPGEIAEFNRRARAAIFLGPALLFLSANLIIPAIRTLYTSLLDRESEDFVGLDNFQGLVQDEAFVDLTFSNTLWWALTVTFASTLIGLIIAVIAERAGKLESTAKSLIFMPMAVSFVGASIIWRFQYAPRNISKNQTGVLNAVWIRIGSLSQSGWPRLAPFNNVFLMVILIWAQAGFAMVILSAAIKAVPGELIEAAKIDGADESQQFFRVILPQILPSVGVVVTATVVGVAKVFDIVKVSTGGNFGTNVLANDFFTESFQNQDRGTGSAIAVTILITVAPILIFNIRQMQKEAV
ncbi:UNVERIFIED_CONTAM: hypothetical protein GTU68_013624 [Idotea baltica]|nr:hypothetical protein [Idotea baltica]